MAAPISINGIADDLLNQAAARLSASGETLATNIVRHVKIETALTPTIDVDTRESAGGQPSAVETYVLNMLRPKVTLDTLFGPVVVMPNGEPGVSKWPYVKWGLIIGGLALGFFAARGVLK